MRKLFAALTAILLAGGIAFGASVPLPTGPWDPSNALGFLNALVQSLNFNSPGLNTFIPGPVGSSASVSYNFANVTIPTGQFTSAGQGFRVTCGGIGANVSDAKTLYLTVGSVALSSGTFTNLLGAWEMQLIYQVSANPVTAGAVYTGHSIVQGTDLSGQTKVWSGVDATTNNSINGIVVQCGKKDTGADLTMETFTIEQIK